MKTLQPLTIINSVKGNPSVLLTSDLKKYVLHQPLDREAHLQCQIHHLLAKHFKIERSEVGLFSHKGIQYICKEKIDGEQEFLFWFSYLPMNKSIGQRFINPSILFKMLLLDFYFPFFSSSTKLIIPGKNERFRMDGVPRLRKSGFVFESQLVHYQDFETYGLNKFFSFHQEEIKIAFEDFKALHHDELYKDLKYQVSLFSEIRNQYWKEIELCFYDDFKEGISSKIEDYLRKLHQKS